MGAAAFGLAGTDAVGNFTDAGAVARLLHEHVCPAVGALFAILLLDASLIGANEVGLATTYALGDTFGKRHSLHWKLTEAPTFYLGYGVLLPSATVFLVLLCNDKAVLGPWINTALQNLIAGVIVWSLVLLSLTAATFLPDLSTQQLKTFFVAGAIVGVLGGLDP